jgi:hypothetical protein
VNEGDEERLLRRGREGSRQALPEPEQDDDRRRDDVEMRDQRQRRREDRRDRLSDEQETPAVEAVRRAARPRGEEQDRCELDEAENTEEKLRAREAEDEDRGGEVLKPRPARGQRVAEEVRSELAGADEPECRSRADAPTGRPRVRCRLGYALPALCSAV